MSPSFSSLTRTLHHDARKPSRVQGRPRELAQSVVAAFRWRFGENGRQRARHGPKNRPPGLRSPGRDLAALHEIPGQRESIFRAESRKHNKRDGRPHMIRRRVQDRVAFSV
jgi:hypothetical protein